jgi:hypothetical protein
MNKDPGVLGPDLVHEPVHAVRVGGVA